MKIYVISDDDLAAEHIITVRNLVGERNYTLHFMLDRSTFFILEFILNNI